MAGSFYAVGDITTDYRNLSVNVCVIKLPVRYIRTFVDFHGAVTEGSTLKDNNKSPQSYNIV